MWAVYDNGADETEIFDTLELAEKCFKKWKEIDGDRGVEDGTEIYIFQTIKKAILVEDKEIEIDAKAYGFSKWVRFEDVYLEND